MSDKANEPMGTCGNRIARLHTKRSCSKPELWQPLPTQPVDAPPADPGPLCADCNHPKDDSRFHLEAPGDNWGAALHHFVPAASAQEDLERAQKWAEEFNLDRDDDVVESLAAEFASLRRAAQAERQVAGAGKFTVTFRPYPAGAGSRVHDESWTIEGNSLRDALDKFYCKPEFNSEWRVVDVALPAERVSAEELAKAILDVVERMRKEAECVLRPPEMNNAKTWASPLLFWAGEMESKLATLRPTHTPESGD
jgi:hypothetical protein